MEEVEEFKNLGMWVDRKLQGNAVGEDCKKGKRVDWKGDMDALSGAEVWWMGARPASGIVESAQMRVGRRLLEQAIQ